MFKSVVSLLLSLSFATFASGQQAEQGKEQTLPNPSIQTGRGFVSPSELNVRLDPDVRTFVVMAAVNIAGFDTEPGGLALTPARAELRKDLASLDPAIKQKLAAFYQSHRRPEFDEVIDAGRYSALSLLMTQPPAFTITDSVAASAPPDLKPLIDFVPLVREFYLKGGLRELAPKYLGIGTEYATAYRRPVGELIYQALNYFHTVPDTIINMRPFLVRPDTATSKKSKPKPKAIERSRTRQVFIIPDPLAGVDTSFVRGDLLNQKDDILVRRTGDDYIILIGPSRTPNMDGIRQAMIRFVIDPLVERHLKTSLEYKDQISALVGKIPTAQKEYEASVYLVVRESLAQASEARMRRILASENKASYTEEDAVFDLAQAYLRGAALVFHFYESLQGLEQVGINIEDFFDEMMKGIKFDREATRPRDFEPVVARVTASRAAAGPKSSSNATSAAEPGASTVAAKILLSDDLIRNRRFEEARPVLEEVLVSDPGNARALYGLAQIISQTPSRAEADPKADEDDKIQAQYDRLKKALEMFDKVIEHANGDSERWLVQWSHVLKGRILDFQEFRSDAVAEYSKALAMGDNISNGAYKEALEGKDHPYGQR